MRSLPLDVGTSPIGRLHRVHVEGAVISGELGITPLLLRICDKLFNLLHHLAHLVLRGFLVLLSLHLSLVTIVLLLVFIADSLFVRHGILVLVLACSLDGNALFIVSLVHLLLLHLLNLGGVLGVVHHGFLLHLVLLGCSHLLLLHVQLHLLLLLRSHLVHLLLHHLLLLKLHITRVHFSHLAHVGIHLLLLHLMHLHLLLVVLFFVLVVHLILLHLHRLLLLLLLLTVFSHLLLLLLLLLLLFSGSCLFGLRFFLGLNLLLCWSGLFGLGLLRLLLLFLLFGGRHLLLLLFTVHVALL